VGTVSVAAVFFVFMSYAFSIGYGKKAVGEAAWAFSPSVMDDLGTKYISSWYAGLLDLIVILDATALALAICVLIGRGFFALGRDGLLPRAFAKTSRYDTPWVGNLMVAVGGIGLMVIVWSTDYLHRFVVPGPDGKLIPAFPNNQFAVFILTATIGSFAIELVYLALALFSFRLVRQGANKPWQYLVVAVAVATPILGFYGALSPSPHNRSNYNWEAGFWALGLVVVAAAWFAIVLATRRANVDAAAAHAAEHHGVPPLDETLGFQPAD
jgi:amino acid transporter